MKPIPMYETKSARAKRLGPGSWFVWPELRPVRNKYFQPKLYYVRADGSISSPVHEELGIWEIKEGANSPEAAYDRILALAVELKLRNAAEQDGVKYVREIMKERSRQASEKLSAYLFRNS